MVHSMRLVLRPELGNNYVKDMDLDINKNNVFVRMKNSDILVVQLIARKDFCIISDRIPVDPSDPSTAFKWQSRMKCYLEGTNKGLVKIRDIENKGECIMILQTGFTERVQHIHYSSDKNVVFLGARDGRFQAFKVPNEWRLKSVELREQEYQYRERASLLEINKKDE